MTAVTPSIQCLNTDQIQAVHHHSLDILSTTGIRVDSPKAVALFAKFSCRIENKNQVFIEAPLVKWALESAPSSINIYNRTGDHRFSLGGPSQESTRFGVGITNLYYQDPLTDQPVPFSINHMETAVRLGNALDEFDVISTPGIAKDLDPKNADLFSSLSMVANTTKPLVMLISEYNCFEPALEMIESLHGNLAEHPFVIPYFNPITPLVLNEETAEKILITVGRNMPFIYNNYGMSGATTPITPGGTLALLNAELLAGIVFAQIIKEGTPVIAGNLPAGFDMKNMMSVYTPHTMLINLACAEMMNYYEIPHSGTSGSGPGWGPDLIAGGAFWMNHLTSIMGKVGLAPGVGGNFDSMVFSPAAVVYANEVIRLSRIFHQGFSIEDPAVNLDEIKTLGSAGNYMAAPSTAKQFRKFRFESPIWPVHTLEQWQADKSPEAGIMLREYTARFIETLKAPQDHDDLMNRGKQFISTLDKAYPPKGV